MRFLKIFIIFYIKKKFLNADGNSNQATNKTNVSNTPVKKGVVQISSDGRIKNVPPNMLLDQFGMLGLLAYIKNDRDKENNMLAMGTDLTALGLNLNSAEYVLIMFDCFKF